MEPRSQLTVSEIPFASEQPLTLPDHAYLVCEPPGEPYYLARIMEFLHQNNDPNAPIDAVRVNWYYRPKDIGRRVQDTRVVFASMHSDTCPLASLRGKCNIQHTANIANLETFRKQKDCFWFDKLYDRYMHRYYEVIPTGKVVNVPARVKAVLDERWKFVLIEVGRSRDLTNPSKRCIRCEQFAANQDSVDCAVCKNTYHMRCVRPPLLKKPARGFAWACAACSRKQELKLEARNTPALSESAQTPDEEVLDDEDDENQPIPEDTRESSAVPEEHPPPTAAQIAQANLWPWRYLGVHSRVEDALDYDDRIYPRASSRLGPRHQANVNVWHGRPVELVKPAEIKKKYQKPPGSKKDGKMTKETLAQIEADKDSRQKRPKWVLDEPPGYVARGEDELVEIKGKKEHTAQLTFKMPDPSKFTERGTEEPKRPENAEALVDDYMAQVRKLAGQYDVPDGSVDLLTKGIEKLQACNYDVEEALAAMRSLSKKGDLKLPDLNREEVKRFEEGVQKYGSELHLVARHVGTAKESRIVRFYYMWKKSERGRQIWGNFEGRRSKKESRRLDKTADGKVEDIADDADDSAFDNDKAVTKKRGFECKHCGTRHSRVWRRAPQTSPGTLVPADSASKNSKDKSNWLAVALCGKCAYLWRRYAIQYENIEEISKKIALAGGRAAKRKIDEELLQIHYEAHFEAGDPISLQTAAEVHKAGVEVPSSIVQYEEPPKKKAKADKDVSAAATPEVVPEKKKPAEKVPEQPLVPDPPKVKLHPCAVCHVIEVPGHALLKCRDCRLHVHGACYGVAPNAQSSPWWCDMCRNDQNTQVSTIYECLLCPVTYTHQELMEPLKVSHKKKTDREREKERLEREMVVEASKRWRHEQEAAGRPVNPREPLKRTAWNNWVHIVCALWTPEIKFANAELLDDAEGVGFIPPERYENVCKVCKEVGRKPTHQCHLPTCNATFHIGCAHQAGYIFGFDVTPVKSTRRDSVQTVKLANETGLAVPGIWCPNHPPSTNIHSMVQLTDDEITTALQLYARTYKQADTSITGTVRRAQQFAANAPVPAATLQASQRPSTTVNGVASGSGTADISNGPGRQSASPSPGVSRDEMDHNSSGPTNNKADSTTCNVKTCCTCTQTVSPKWWRVHLVGEDSGSHLAEPRPQINGFDSNQAPESSGLTNGIIKKEPRDQPGISGAPAADRKMWQCHKCHVEKKAPPSSPSQIRAPDPPASEPVQESSAQEPLPFTQSVGFAYPGQASHDPGVPPHAHPQGPPPPVNQHSPWPLGPAQWTDPILRGNPPQDAYGPPPPPPLPRTDNYQPTWAPPRDRPVGTVQYGVPPPLSAPVGLQHSPPPSGPYGMAYGVAPPPPSPQVPGGLRPASPPRNGYNHSRSGLGIGGYMARSYPDSGPGPTLDPNVYGPRPPHPSTPSWPQPPPAHPARPPSTHSHLSQIAQAASDQAGAPHHSRIASNEGTPRLSHSVNPVGGYPSPTGAGGLPRPITPGDARAEEVRAERERPGASASPSLRNLLS